MIMTRMIQFHMVTHHIEGFIDLQPARSFNNLLQKTNSENSARATTV